MSNHSNLPTGDLNERSMLEALAALERDVKEPRLMFPRYIGQPLPPWADRRGISPQSRPRQPPQAHDQPVPEVRVHIGGAMKEKRCLLS